MNERDLWWKIVVVGALVALAWASVWPLDQHMKFGIDLYGGYSLLYEIDDSGLDGPAKQNLSERVMRVLRERVDPKGVYNLVWRPVGHNRLEIQMPRPSDDVRKARVTYERLQEEIQGTILRRSDVVRAVSKAGPERTAACDALVHNIEIRKIKLDAAGEAYDAYKKAEAEYGVRKAEVEADHLTEAMIETAMKANVMQRPGEIEALIRGVEGRDKLLQDTAKTWDDYQLAKLAAEVTDPNAQPDPEKTKAEANTRIAFDKAVERVLKTNPDPDTLTEGTTTIDTVVELEMAFDHAVSDVVATNIDRGRLQAILAAKIGDTFRTVELEKLTKQYPSLADLFNGLVASTDELHKQRKGEGRLEDPADLQRLLRGAGVLEFRILPTRDPTNPDQFATYYEALQARGPRPLPGEENYQWFVVEDILDFLNQNKISQNEFDRDFETKKLTYSVIVDRFGDKYYALSHIGDRYELTHRAGEADWSLKSASPGRDQNGRPAITFRLDERGGDKFSRLTRLNKDQQLAIFLDDEVVSHATIITTIRTHGQITGSFTQMEVQEAVKKLNAGSLPKKLKDPPISVRSIGPSLGEANRTAGITAAYIGAALVAVFMIVYYFYSGVIAVIAVGFNMLFIAATMVTMGATLTLPGIAGLVLAMGMAVDANVLINERIREELRRGTAMRMAVKLGYERAFRAILDSNVTTILTCLILFMLGSEEIKGFGLTLGIGVFINIFTAYFITRIFFQLMTMVSVPREIARYPIYAAIAIAAFGGAVWGLGYQINDPLLRDQSVLMLFGKSIFWIGPAIIGLTLVMWLARAVHGVFQKGTKPSIPMLRLIGTPKINWIGSRSIFFTISFVMVVTALWFFTQLDREDKFDIEFLGGTAAQIDLKEGKELDQEAVMERLGAAGATLEGFGERIAQITVTGSSDTYTIETPGIPAVRLEPMIRTILDKDLSQIDAIRYDEPGSERVTIRTKTEAKYDLEKMKARMAEFGPRFVQAGEAITAAQVQKVEAVGADAEQATSFEIVTRETNKEIVVGAIMEQLQSEIDVQPALTFEMVHNTQAGNKPYFAIRSDNPRELGFEMNESEAASANLQGWTGGVAIVLDNITPPQKIDVLKRRLRSMRLQPGFEQYGWRESDVFGLRAAGAATDDTFSRVLVAVFDENFPLVDEQGGLSSTWESELAEPEVELLTAALKRQTSLKQITQFDQQVSGEAQLDAYIALALSCLVIVIYVWFRFGNIRWGLSAVAALVHDVIIGVGCIAATHFAVNHIPGLAELLMLDKFRIDLALVAALLTVVGYSVNDTIVVFDRIRENRGRMAEVTNEMVNNSISQTLSRTLLTLLTSLLAVFTMYAFGGRGIHGFSFVLFIGLAIGTYSSIGIASQFLVLGRSKANA